MTDSSKPSPELEAKWRKLLNYLQGLGSCLVAFSGGVDSSLLLAACQVALAEKCAAAICLGPFTPEWEIKRARGVAELLKAKLFELDSNELSQNEIAANDVLRCYHCKKHRMTMLMQFAADYGIGHVVEGSQLDDAHDYRPGEKAIAELGIKSPLRLVGMNKADVRAMSRGLGLPTADIPSAACLASRVPYGRPLDETLLGRIEKAEASLMQLMPGKFRVRDHFPLARLELDPGHVAEAAAPHLRGKIVAALKNAGYEFICLDLEGYRPGGGNNPKGGNEE